MSCFKYIKVLLFILPLVCIGLVPKSGYSQYRVPVDPNVVCVDGENLPEVLFAAIDGTKALVCGKILVSWDGSEGFRIHGVWGNNDLSSAENERLVVANHGDSEFFMTLDVVYENGDWSFSNKPFGRVARVDLGSEGKVYNIWTSLGPISIVLNNDGSIPFLLDSNAYLYQNPAKGKGGILYEFRYSPTDFNPEDGSLDGNMHIRADLVGKAPFQLTPENIAQLHHELKLEGDVRIEISGPPAPPTLELVNRYNEVDFDQDALKICLEVGSFPGFLEWDPLAYSYRNDSPVLLTVESFDAISLSPYNISSDVVGKSMAAGDVVLAILSISSSEPAPLSKDGQFVTTAKDDSANSTADIDEVTIFLTPVPDTTCSVFLSGVPTTGDFCPTTVDGLQLCSKCAIDPDTSLSSFGDELPPPDELPECVDCICDLGEPPPCVPGDPFCCPPGGFCDL